MMDKDLGMYVVDLKEGVEELINDAREKSCLFKEMYIVENNNVLHT